MRNQPGVAANQTEFVTVLSITPLEDDHAALQTIIGDAKWMLLQADSLPNARNVLRHHKISVILCECDLKPRTWPHPPSLIVASRIADERLWAKAHNSNVCQGAEIGKLRRHV